MGLWPRKLFRCSVHALAAFMLLVAIASAVFWVRSQSMDEGIQMAWRGTFVQLGASDSRWEIHTESDAFAGSASLGVYVYSAPHAETEYSPWTYTKLGWTPQWFGGYFDLYAVRWWQTQHGRALDIPFSYTLPASLAFSLWWFRRTWKTRHIRAAGLCKKCGYDLRPSPTRCPECGTAVQTAG